MERAGGALRLHAVCRRAARLGLRPGVSLADAEARHRGCETRPADPAADAAFLARLAVRAGRWSPSVAAPPRIDASADLVLDATGVAHLFGGEAALREAVLGDLRALGFSARAALAGPADLAVALARHDGPGLVAEQEEARAARALPIEALRLPGPDPVPWETVAGLRRAGLRTVGEVAGRSRAALAARFGPGLVAQLDRLLGGEGARPSPHRPRPPVLVERRFSQPLVGADALARALGLALAEACRTLERRGTGARAIEAGLARPDGRRARLVVESGRPLRDPALLLGLFVGRLERLADPGAAGGAGEGFEAVALRVLREAPLAPSQPGLDGQDGGEEALGDLLDRLAARLGPEAVRAFEPQDTHDPAREACLAPPAREARLVPPGRRGRRAREAAPHAGPAAWPAIEPGGPPARPITLFEPPEPIEALSEVPDGPPLRFRWRRGLHEVARAEGPERIEPDWWEREGPDARRARDYFRVEDAQGRRFWVFREGRWGEAPPPRWFLHGLFA